MAHIAIRVLNIQIEKDTLFILSEVSVGPTSEALVFTTPVGPSGSVVDINTAIIASAIARAEAAGFTVGLLDKKVIYGGPVGP